MWESEEKRGSRDPEAKLREGPAGMESSRDRDVDPDRVALPPGSFGGEASSSPCSKPHGYLCKELLM